MTLKELRLFYLLSSDPHISHLAQRVGMCQSAISLAIKSLERKLGEPLFDRIGKKLVLNERGRYFREHTYPHFQALEEAQDLFRQETLSGILKIASSKTIGNFIMPQVIFDFLSTHQECSITNEIANSADIIQMVQEGSIDMGLIESTCNQPDILKEPFGSDRLIVVSGDKKLSNRRYYIDQLFDKKWIMREPGSGTREVFLEAIGDISSELPLFMHYKDSQEVKSILTQNREAITCVSKYVVEKELLRGELFAIEIKNLSFERTLFIIYHKHKYKSRLMETLIDAIRQSVGHRREAHP